MKSIRCRLGSHRHDLDDRQRHIDMGPFGVKPTPSDRCRRCGTHRIWLYGIGWSGVRYGPEENLVNQSG